MSSTELVYTTAMLKEFGYLATWLPGSRLSLGLVGVLKGKTFVPKSSIRSLGVAFRSTTEPHQRDGYLRFQSSKDVELQVGIGGQVDALVPAVPDGDARVAVSFGEGTGVVFAARGLAITRVADVLALQKAIWDLRDRYLWNDDWVVITELVTVDKATILVSNGSYAKVELKAAATVPAGPVDLGELTGELVISSSYGMHTQLVAENGLTPLFRAVRLRRGLFKTKIDGVRDPIVASSARRGEPCPEGELLEAVID